MKKQMLTLAVIGSLMSCGQAWAAEPQTPPPAVDAGVDLNRNREMMEREQMAEQMEKDQEAAANKVEGNTGTAQNAEQETVTFTLNKLTLDPSTVLTDEELNNITADYISKEVSVNDLYDIVAKINAVYEKKGYLTCKAFLTAQEIKDGSVHITLIEGKTGTTEVTGNKYTKADYITNRLHLKSGDVADINVLNSDLLRFCATNDAQLHIVMKAGVAPGTTDYVIETYEPKQNNFNIFFDNAGNYASGELRGGIFYTIKSLTGERDPLSIGGVFSSGTRAGSLSYSHSVGRSGSKVGFSFSANTVKQVKNDSDNYTKGRANAFNLSFVQPWIVTAHTRSDVSLEFSNQNSSSDIIYRNAGNRYNILNDTLRDFTLGYSLTNYGTSYVFYQKHSYTRGHYSSDPNAFSGSSGNYGFYKFTGLYQKRYQHGQIFSTILNGQYAGNQTLRSARQFYIGGMYSVRGYKENYLGGDSGLSLNLEYSVPITLDRKTNAFIFYDFGDIYGKNAESNNVVRVLSSVGFGVKSAINKNIFASLTFGHPLRRNFQDVKTDSSISPWRVNFVISGQF